MCDYAKEVLYLTRSGSGTPPILETAMICTHRNAKPSRKWDTPSGQVVTGALIGQVCWQCQSEWSHQRFCGLPTEGTFPAWVFQHRTS
jgi:hypothetical protein